LAKTPLTFVDLDWIAGAFSPPEYHTESHKKALALSDELVSELLEADEIILGTPMYNFSIPAALKAWIDHIVRAGKTFRYRADGTPEGSLAGKKMLVIVASGGSYDERSGMSALDHEVPYLRFIFGFMGITDVHVMQAGGTGAVMKGRISAEEFLSTLFGRNRRSRLSKRSTLLIFFGIVVLCARAPMPLFSRAGHAHAIDPQPALSLLFLLAHPCVPLHARRSPLVRPLHHPGTRGVKWTHSTIQPGTEELC
jgi:FMN-dependent NADH-azoreductase